MSKNGRLFRQAWSYSIEMHKIYRFKRPSSPFFNKNLHRGHWVWKCVIRNCTSGLRSSEWPPEKKSSFNVYNLYIEISKVIHQKQWSGGEIQRFLECSPRNLGKWSSLTSRIFQMGWNHHLEWVKYVKWPSFSQHSGLSGVSLKLEFLTSV